MLDEIRIKRAAQHNLKAIDVSLPRNKLIVVTGPSGSGKSSLAFDTLFAEGQRRYIECLSAYARQFIDQMEKPEVESVEGISPSISIDQKTISSNPRSTVGTITEVHDLFRLLFARVGAPHCPSCGREVSSQTPEEILARLREGYADVKVRLFAPVVKGRKGEYQRLFERFRRKGFLRVRVNGALRDLEDDIPLEKNRKHTIEVLVDTAKVGPDSERRLAQAVDKALELSSGELLVVDEKGRERFFSLTLLCPVCEVSLPELEPRSFSFNSPYGACAKCHGLGYRTALDEWGETALTDDVCPECRGARLKKESLSVRVGGRNIHEVGELSIRDLLRETSGLAFPPSQQLIASRVTKEIGARLGIMEELGMSYLQLNRTASSLSGGEAQRVRLAAQVGSRLRGVLYVLDEPTIGLHQRDNGRLISLLRTLRDEGNSIVVVEHDEQTIRAADHILDLGPGAGEAGGYKVAEGPLPVVLESPVSLTAQYLRGERSVPVPSVRRRPSGWLTVHKAREHNLKGVDVRVPLSVMTAVTGVSGSGKSTLVTDILFKALTNRIHKARHRVGAHDRLTGAEGLDKVVAVDQKPIGRTPRSNPATYTGLFTALRDLFAHAPEARARGYSAGRFSFNVAGGRCEECEGAGVKKIEMHFLPDVFVTCDRCEGKRYNKETLAVTYKGKNIADFLAMTVDDAIGLLKAHPQVKRKLAALQKVGLGYLRLGQPAPTLSGGEAQRIKLTKELGRRATGQTLYLLDEPTTGLHFDDVRKLLEVLSELAALGNTVVIIEHNLEVIKYCDYIIDLGPEGGEEGGRVVAQGTPEAVAGAPRSYTGQYLKRALGDGRPSGKDD
ncbi:MAG: excinuclease ABC subunit A [Candidatus Aminicenantes bacterium]|nr:excinuclease ABC subunit A [Candidatus Aminicenantes bacterium]